MIWQEGSCLDLNVMLISVACVPGLELGLRLPRDCLPPVCVYVRASNQVCVTVYKRLFP